MSVTVADIPAGPLLRVSERTILALRLTLAMAAAALLVVALAWQAVFPDQALVAQLVAGGAALLVTVPVLTSAWHSLRHPSLHGVTDRLIALALVAAWATGDLMTAALLPIVMIIGHVLEERSLLGSNEAIRALTRLTDTNCRRLRPDGSEEVVAATALRPGDRIALRAGDRVPADGIVRHGNASLDMASLTGESVPVEVAPGDAAVAGAIDTDGLLEIEVTRVGADSTLGRIISLMRAAERAKPPVTRLLERHAGHYMILIFLLAAGVWFATRDSNAMLAVLVASCPCALVMAAPATAVAAIAVAARHGILIKGSAFLEQLADVTSIVFDKTGTLTVGELSLVGVVSEEADGLLPLAAALGAGSSHPVSRAIARMTTAERPALDELREASGFGMTARCDGDVVALGRPDLFVALGVACPSVPAHDGPIAGVSRGGRFLGWMLFADTPRPESRAALAELREMGLARQLLLTGDREAVATRIAGELGIGEVFAQALPDQKMTRVMDEIRAGFRPMVVDLVLMTSDLRRLATCLRLSRRCRRTIHTNVAIGLGWTVVLVALASAGALGAEGAVVAALLHNLSTLLGLGNAGRLLRFNELDAPA
jgi:heavy metal translocating P-type ATPase